VFEWLCVLGRVRIVSGQCSGGSVAGQDVVAVCWGQSVQCVEAV
jgi:hypothetical protein